MPRLIFIFLDGVGLGTRDPLINPLARFDTPVISHYLNGKTLVIDDCPLENEYASLIALDTRLGIDGAPQSATGQAVLLTGINLPAKIGQHYGPKPTPEIINYLNDGNLFNQTLSLGKKAALLNAYPPRYFASIQSRKRLYSVIPYAVTQAGINLFTQQDLEAGRALSADFTGAGWRDRLGIPGIPQLTPYQAGKKLAELASGFDLSFFEFWLSDYAGHHQDMNEASKILKSLDQVIAGLLSMPPGAEELILLTSDHGNLEDLSTRHHTLNPVPLLLFGTRPSRRWFLSHIHTMMDICPTIVRWLSK